MRASFAARVTTTLDGDTVTLGFGPQVKAVPLDVDGHRKIAPYVAKYCSKSADQGGVLDHRIREGELALLDLPAHAANLVRTVFALAKTPEHSSCARFALTLGWSGPPLTKSRRYSTTFCKLRLARRAWRKAETGESEPIGSTTWTFEGLGFRYEIDRVLQRSAEERFELGRRESYRIWCESRAGDEL